MRYKKQAIRNVGKFMKVSRGRHVMSDALCHCICVFSGSYVDCGLGMYFDLR